MSYDEHKVALPCDIYENDDEYLVIADAPGVSSSGLDVTVHGDRLTVRGERSGSDAQRTTYERVFTLPQNAEQSAVTATARDGVVKLRIPKSADSKPRRIEVRTN